MASLAEFPPVRACIFDMGGLLINTEGIIIIIITIYEPPDAIKNDSCFS